MSIRPIPLLFVVGAALAGAAGTASCGETILAPLCQSDAECIAEHDGNPNWYCHDRGQCVCRNDDACGPNEHCAVLPKGDGTCKPDQACDTNADCPDGETCGKNGTCTPGCIDDLQCRLGEVCDPITEQCVTGCWSAGDCAERASCICDAGAGTFQPCTCEDPSRGCQLGTCRTDVCADRSFCRYGELCVPDAQGLGRCQKDERGRYCSDCTGTGNCGSPGPDFCLNDTSDPGRRARFCGVDCDSGQECPRGFGCIEVLVLTSQPCTGACPISPSAPTCDRDENCPAGSRCAQGRCAGLCFIAEGASEGFCGCVTHDECPQDVCQANGRCSVTRRPCSSDPVDTCAGNILCVNDGSGGFCRIGANCAPEDGLTCADIRSRTGE